MLMRARMRSFSPSHFQQELKNMDTRSKRVPAIYEKKFLGEQTRGVLVHTHSDVLWCVRARVRVGVVTVSRRKEKCQLSHPSIKSAC
jgi:hypothetical protein